MLSFQRGHLAVGAEDSGAVLTRAGRTGARRPTVRQSPSHHPEGLVECDVAVE